MHKNPEVAMKEHNTHNLLSDYMEKNGFKVIRHAYDIETAFVAEYSQGQGRHIGICSELDAWPG